MLLLTFFYLDIRASKKATDAEKIQGISLFMRKIYFSNQKHFSIILLSVMYRLLNLR